jgi:hypothetical protein
LTEQELFAAIAGSWYGDHWRASMASEFGVRERLLRRWAAGTEKIPEEVWRGIARRLEARKDAELYRDAVKLLLRGIDGTGGRDDKPV